MFARLPDVAADVPVVIDGIAHFARAGDTVAAALLAAGVGACRCTPVSAAPRGPFCLMAACFDCMVEVDGVPMQGCVVRVAPGMRIDALRGARRVGDDSRNGVDGDAAPRRE